MSARAKDNSLSIEEFVEQANDAHAFDYLSINSLLEACEAFYINGQADEVSGDVEAPTGHFYRVHRFLVITDSQGFREVTEYDNEVEAGKEFDVMNKQYEEWADDGA